MRADDFVLLVILAGWGIPGLFGMIYGAYCAWFK